MDLRESRSVRTVSLVTRGGECVRPDRDEVTLLATSESGALLDALVGVHMDLTCVAESRSLSKSAKIERLRFAIVTIDAVVSEIKKARGLDLIARAR